MSHRVSRALLLGAFAASLSSFGCASPDTDLTEAREVYRAPPTTTGSRLSRPMGRDAEVGDKDAAEEFLRQNRPMPTSSAGR